MSNLISMFISTIIVIIVPKLIGVKPYGYWQLYLFYSSYVGFFHFGWNDGIYLRFGGATYKSLNKSLFFSQFWMLFLTQLGISIIILATTFYNFNDIERIYIFRMIAICLLITNVRYMLLFILQSTNRIKEYAKITILEKLLYTVIISALLIIGNRDYKTLITADLIGKIVALVLAIYYCKDIVFQNFSNFYFSYREAFENISVGIKLMFSNLASKFVIGIVRFGIERTWDVTTFGKVSLTLSISNFVMLFINAIGIIMFPILRRVDEKKLPHIYLVMRNFLMSILLGGITIYYPLKEILSIWLPKYSDSLYYMALLFPMCIYEGKMALLINTYLKTLRKEKLMLRINIISLVLSALITIISSFLIKNLDIAVISIITVLAFRGIFSEILLSKIVKVSVINDILLEFLMTIVFIASSWYLETAFAAILYITFYIMYLIFKRKDLINSLKNIKLLLKT